MCVYIKQDPDWNKIDLQNFIEDREEIDIYKVLQKYNDENFYRSFHYSSFIWDFKIQKTFQVNRPLRPTEVELYDGQIHKGFHVYTSLEVAKSYRLYNYTVIVKFRVKAEDIVAVENDYYREEENFQELVCRKLTYVEVIN
jgi:hypothetical protein